MSASTLPCLGEEEQSALSSPKVGKTEVLYTKDIESVISSLTGPLQVVHNVDPSEVLQNIEAWIPAIENELQAVGILSAYQPLAVWTRCDLLRLLVGW